MDLFKSSETLNHSLSNLAHMVLTGIFSNLFVITFLRGSKEQWLPSVLV